MSKTLWNTIKIQVPDKMVNITKNDKVTVKKALTKTNNISKSDKQPSIKIIPGDVNKPKIISDGKEWNVEELKIRMKKAKDLGKKNEGKEYKKQSMKLVTNVGMVKGNQIASNYASYLRFKNNYKQLFLKAKNSEGVKWVDILNMYSKQDLIDWYNDNIIKNKSIHYKKIWKKSDKDKYFVDIPKYFNETTKTIIINRLMVMDLFPFYHTYKNKEEYKKLKLNVDKSFINQEKIFTNGHDVIFFYDKENQNTFNGRKTSLDF